MRSVSITIRGVAWLLGILVLVSPPFAVVAEEEKPLAERVVEAHRRGDTDALKRIAAAAGFTAWDVVEAVLSRPDGPDAARAFMKAWADPDHAALLRYLGKRQKKPQRAEAVLALQEAHRALRAGRAVAARGLLEGAVFEKESVSAIRALEVRSLVLREEQRAVEAAGLLLEAATAAERIGWRGGAASFLRAAALLLQEERDLAGARAAFERRYNLLRGRGDDAPAASCLGNLASTCAQQGDFPAALRHYTDAIEALASVKEWRNAALTRANLGSLYLDLGRFEGALTQTERALAELDEHGTAPDRAETMAVLGNIHQALGQYEKALGYQEQAVAIMRAHMQAATNPTGDDRVALAIALGNCGNTCMLLERHEEARRHLQEALAIFEQLPSPYFVALALANLSELSFRRGNLVGAAVANLAALTQLEQMGAEAEAVVQRLWQGRILAAREKPDEALVRFLETQGTAERLRLYSLAVDAMTEAGDILLSQGKTKEAQRLAFGAVDVLGSSLAHLADSEGAAARESRLRTYQLPVRVAMAIGDANACAEALDEARAGSFLESFGGRAVLQEIALPQDLRVRLREAQAGEERVWAQARRALRAQSIARRKDASRRLEKARKNTDAVHDTIQRTAKHSADLVYPRADALDEVQAELETGDALVLYALMPEQSVALLVTKESVWIRPLAPEAEIAAACDALFASDEYYVDPSKAPALAEKILGPLKLPKGVRRLLISPDGALTYVPFALLARGLQIACVPSGTTYRTLRAAKDLRGESVVAFGDPAYERHKDSRRLALYGGAGRTTLLRLKASGDEARAVGTKEKVFVRERATETNLREALTPARQGARIRSLLLAGHGLANPDTPQLSCIALAPSEEDDGFLLAREVLAMEVPADLVVLSACGSVRGKVVRGEGLQGLMRAFLFAGAPRVLATLWKVDDEAARAFVEKFYALWYPPQGEGLPTAEALQKTQVHMRTKTKWKHPEHWAAWVLWGLPD